MRVFHTYANYPKLPPTRGDFINEIGLLNAIKQFGTIVKDHRKGADLYIVRGRRARDLFMKLPHPKAYKVSPYDAGIYAAADAILTPSSEWTKMLREGTHKPLHGTPCKATAITIHQFIPPGFKPLQDHPITQEIRKKLGGGFIIGQFGTIRPSNFPHSFLAVLPRLRKKYPHLNVVFSDPKVGALKGIQQRKFPYTTMPYVLSACDLILYSEWTAQGHFCGSLKIKEAMGCGVPILSPRFRAREEELGTDYEFFYPWVKKRNHAASEITDSLFDLISRAVEDKDFRSTIGKKLIRRAEFYSLEQGASRLKRSFEKLIDRCKR